MLEDGQGGVARAAAQVQDAGIIWEMSPAGGGDQVEHVPVARHHSELVEVVVPGVAVVAGDGGRGERGIDIGIHGRR